MPRQSRLRVSQTSSQRGPKWLKQTNAICKSQHFRTCSPPVHCNILPGHSSPFISFRFSQKTPSPHISSDATCSFPYVLYFLSGQNGLSTFERDNRSWYNSYISRLYKIHSARLGTRIYLNICTHTHYAQHIHVRTAYTIYHINHIDMLIYNSTTIASALINCRI